MVTGAIPAQDVPGPGDRVRGPHPGWLWPNPQLEVFRAIVVLDAVPVVHVFAVGEISPEKLFHKEDVLKDVPIGGLRLRVRWHAPQHVSSFVLDSSAAPITVAGASFGLHEPGGADGDRNRLLVSPMRVVLFQSLICW